MSGPLSHAHLIELARPWWASHATPDQVRAYQEARAATTLRDAHVVEIGSAHLVWRPLPWDSEMLGVACARIDALVHEASATGEDDARAAVALAVSDWQRRGVVHVSARMGTAQLAAGRALAAQGFTVIDGTLTFGKVPSVPEAPKAEAFRIRETTPGDALQICANFRFPASRFHADPAFSARRADELHEHWIANSCRGAAADAAWVAESGGEACGFISVKRDSAASGAGVAAATIVLVATSEAAQGRGIASALVATAEQWAVRERMRAFDVGTQLKNIAAGRLYERTGFRLVGTSLTYRWSTRIGQGDTRPSGA